MTPKHSPSPTMTMAEPRSAAVRKDSLTEVSGGARALRDPRQVPAETERLVRLRAADRCEACRAALQGTGTCSAVLLGGWRDGPLREGPANTVLLCAECLRLVEELDTRMEARGIWVWSGPDPDLMPMIVPAEDGSWTAVWRSVDGRYLYDPPDGA